MLTDHISIKIRTARRVITYCFLRRLVRKAHITTAANKINTNDIKDVNTNNGEQIVQLSMRDYNYYPNVINLKYNVPAKIIVDTNKVKGCLQSIVIPDFGVRKYVTAKDNIISFTPNKKGTFSFSCSMGMGFGKIVVS